jgi:hypothetical protein
LSSREKKSYLKFVPKNGRNDWKETSSSLLVNSMSYKGKKNKKKLINNSSSIAQLSNRGSRCKMMTRRGTDMVIAGQKQRAR